MAIVPSSSGMPGPLSRTLIEPFRSISKTTSVPSAVKEEPTRMATVDVNNTRG
jgi:hypothetical protein